MKDLHALPLHDRIVQAAIPTFVERGYEKASMDEVAARAGTTKRTVYAHYGNKEELFRAAVVRAVALFVGGLPNLTDITDPAAQLEAFAVAFSNLATWRGAVQLQRVVMGEAERFPDLGAMLHRDVIVRSERVLADYLVRLARERELVPGGELDAWAMATASLFLNMTTGAQRFETLLQASEPHPEHPEPGSSPDRDRARIRQAVTFFMTGLGMGDN
jgi:AcrR family transcriptional regulator